MKLSEKIQEALRQQQEINLSDTVVQKRLAEHWGYVPTDAQPAPSDEYVGWYCAHCERGVDASEVTYHEQHQVCGRVITDDRPPKPAPSVPECPYPCGWQNLLKHVMEDGAYLARAIDEDEPVTENARAVTMRMVMRLRDVLIAINNAAAPETKP